MNTLINKVKKSVRRVAICALQLSLFTSAAMLTASCSDFLDQAPDERTEIDSEDKVVSLLITAYPDANYSWLAELSSDNLLDNQAPHMPSNPNDKQIETHYNYASNARWDEQAYNFESTSTATVNDFDSPGMIWTSYYSSIGVANAALKAIDEITAGNPDAMTPRLRAAKGEALVIRAFSHFVLVSLFSQAYKDAEASKADVGIPYVTEPETQLIVKYDRGNVADVYAKIEADLEEGRKLSSDAYFKAPKYHFNLNAVNALAARFYLYKRDYAKVIEAANAVLGEGTSNLRNMMMNYSVFAGCSYLSDYGTAWQNPELNNNIMLLSTYSILQRKSFGYRYSLAGPKCQAMMLTGTNNPLWDKYIAPPLAITGGMLFGSNTNDYGFFNSKIGEEFEYSDKIAGIGYPHTMQRLFTCNELLLERAEAEIMLGQYGAAAEDLKAYWNVSNESMSEADRMSYADAIVMMTDEMFDSYFAKSDIPAGEEADAKYADVEQNRFENWDFTQQNVSSSFVVPQEAVKYMNCLNCFRRFENVFEGLRFFDLKRWGMPYKHKVAKTNGTQYSYGFVEMKGKDVNRALELPWETMSAGLESSRQTTVDSRSLTQAPRSKFLRNNNNNEE